ncbi:MAG: hypothetical protein ACRC1W_05140 [Shewanella sp.]
MAILATGLTDETLPRATKAEAEAGTDNTKTMSPLRTKEAIAVNTANLATKDEVNAKLPLAGGTLTGGVTAPTFTGALSGNATTATTLQTARTIAGVSFDGGTNIAIPAGNVGAYTKAEVDAKDALKLNLTGGTLSGDLTVKTSRISASIQDTDNDAPIRMASGGIGGTVGTYFMPLTQQSARHDNGYWTHVTTGLVKNGPNTGWGSGVSGFFVGVGGSDSHATEYFTLAYGGKIKHSLGHEFYSTAFPQTTITGNAETATLAAAATKLANARTIALSGDATGSVSFDGQADVTIPVVIANDSHNHTWSNITGAPTTFPPATHTHSYVPLSSVSSITVHADSDSSSLAEFLEIKAGGNSLKVTSSAGGATPAKNAQNLTYNGSKVFHEGYTPTKTHVGLSSVNNWGASTSATSTSATTYATSSAVKTAYDRGTEALNAANTKLPLAGGTLTGGVTAPTFTGALTGNATTATRLQNARTIAGVSFDGGTNIAITTANVGAATGKATSATTPATVGWYRIATSASGTANCGGIFRIITAISGHHSQTVLTAGTCYSAGGASIQQLSHNVFGTAITKARVVYHTTYSGNYAYLEVYLGTAVATPIYVEVISPYGWTLTAPNTAGSIPAGYTNKEITLSAHNIVSNLAGNATTATQLQTSRKINGVSFNGGGDITITAAANGGTSAACTGNAATATRLASTRAINGVNFDGTAAITITAAANGGTSAACSGNAATATKLATKRAINGVDFDGTAAITITAAANGGTSAACSGNAATATALLNTRAINGTNFNGTAAITTANWGTGRTITIGSTGKTVNGSANVSWTLAEIGAQAAGSYAAAAHTHAYLPTAGGTLSGRLITIGTGSDYSSGAIEINGNGAADTVFPTLGFHQASKYASSLQLRGVADFRFYAQGCATYANVTAATFKGALAGNATTATNLQTTRAINGTNFNGSAAITTANWGTGRTITIGSTGKSVNGSANVSWTLAEIGAAAASHTHSYAATTHTHAYAPLTGTGTSGSWPISVTGNAATATTATTATSATTSAGCTGNAATATKLLAKRSINGTDFDGSAGITTANWGTYRTIFIGNSGKPVNGSGDVIWTHKDMGVMPSNSTEGTPIAAYHGVGISSTIGTKVTLPVMANSNKRVAFTIRTFGSTRVSDVTIGGWLSPTANNWANLIVSVTGSPLEVRVGRDADGKAYAWVGANYNKGVAVINVVGAESVQDWRTGWTITDTNTTPNTVFSKTISKDSDVTRSASTTWQCLVFTDNSCAGYPEASLYKSNPTVKSLECLPSTGSIRISGTLTSNYSSDIRIKRNLAEFIDPLGSVCQLRTGYYEKQQIIEGSEADENGDYPTEYVKESGFIAQDLEKVVDGIITEDRKGIKAIKGGGYEIDALLAGAIKQLKREHDEEIDALKDQIHQLTALVQGAYAQRGN